MPSETLARMGLRFDVKRLFGDLEIGDAHGRDAALAPGEHSERGLHGQDLDGASSERTSLAMSTVLEG